jgi:hypothetical protein
MKPSATNPWTRERVLAAFQQAAEANNGEPPSGPNFEKIVPTKAWHGKFFARFSDMVRAAGYEPKQPIERIDESKLLAPVAQLVRRLKRFPTTPELSIERRERPDFPSPKTLKRRFENQRGLTTALLAFCADSADYEDVFHLLRTFEERGDIEQPDSAHDGFVYLMKRGKYYKIGFTNSDVRGRQSQLNRPAPESVPHTAIHSIQTDDPRGIEAYWHRRFADKRREGEYFELSPKDIAAFRRRKKFM